MAHRGSYNTLNNYSSFIYLLLSVLKLAVREFRTSESEENTHLQICVNIYIYSVGKSSLKYLVTPSAHRDKRKTNGKEKGKTDQQPLQMVVKLSKYGS